MKDLSVQTQSLCPRCLRAIPAITITNGNRTFLRKSCSAHGDFEDTLLWDNHPFFYDEWMQPKASILPTDPNPRCPNECGICSHHAQKTCSAIIEVTHRCNLRCPICFASCENETSQDLTLDQLSKMLGSLKDQSGACPIQLSGGEPAMRDDLPEMVLLVRRMGFDHVQINTNGIRLALDPDYGKALADAGVATIFLQFDGVTKDVFLKLRGADLLETKIKAIARCAELRIGVILVPTLVRNVNDGQIGAIIQFAKQWIPSVKGVHFQPMSFIGRYQEKPRNEDRILIPEILSSIESQTGGELRAENMIAPG